MFLLLKQGILSALKNKTQMFVFVVLLCIATILGTSAYTTVFRLNDSNKYMGYGTFSYDYSLKYISTSNDQNDAQTISPWFSFNNDYLSYGENVAKRTYSTLSIGDNEAIRKVNLTEKNFDFKADNKKEWKVDFNIDNVNVEQGIFGDLYHFNLESDAFKTSLVGQIYQNKILNDSKDKIKAKKIVSDYMHSINQSILTKFVKDLIIEFVDKNNSNPDFNSEAKVANRVNEFINGIDDTHWPTKITALNSGEVADVKNDILKYKGLQDPKWGLRGNIGLLVKDDKSTNSNYQYRYFLSNTLADDKKEAQKPVLETGSFKIRNINKYDFYEKYDPNDRKYNSNFISDYYSLVGLLTNYQTSLRHQAIAWDIITKTKYKFIEWTQPFRDNQLKIIDQSKYWGDVKDFFSGSNGSAIINPQYFKANNMMYDYKIELANGFSLNINAIGGDTQNIYPTIYDTDWIPNGKTDAILYISEDSFNALFDSTRPKAFNVNEYQDVSVGQLKHIGKKQDTESDFERFKLYFADNFNNLDVISTAIKDINALKTDSELKDKLRFNTAYSSWQESPLITSRYNLLVKTIKMYSIFMIVCIVFLTCLVVFITITLLRKLIEKQKTQIGIFKSNGYSNFKIIISYWANMVTPILFGTLIGWTIGLFIQIPIMSIFQQYFVIPSGLYITGWPLLYCSILFFVVISLVVIITCYSYLQKPVLNLVYPNSKIKTNKLMSKLTEKIKFKRFMSKFRLQLMGVSMKNIFLFFVTFSIASSALSVAVLLPSSINSLSNEYYKNFNYKNNFRYDNIAYNNPLSRYALYDYEETTDPSLTYPIENAKPIADYVGDTKDTINLLAGDKDYAAYVTKMLFFNIVHFKGTNISLGLFDHIIDNAGKDKIAKNKISLLLQSIACNILPQIFDQLPISPSSPNIKQNIEYCVEYATKGVLPSSIQEAWFNGETRAKNQFTFGFGVVGQNRKYDSLYTAIDNKLIKKNGKTLKPISASAYGISSRNDKLTYDSKYKAQLFDYQANAKEIPILVNKYLANNLGLNIGDKINFNYQANSLQYKTKSTLNEGWENIDPSQWIFQDHDTHENIAYSMDLSKLTYSPQSLNENQIWWYKDKKGRPRKYNNVANFQLKLPIDKINVNEWNNLEIEVSGGKKVKLLDSTNNVVNTTDSISYFIKPYDWKFDHEIDDLAELVNGNFPKTWFHTALENKLIRTEMADFEVPNRVYKIIGLQNTYDQPRIFLDQRYANEILGYKVDNDKTDEQAWFNGKLSSDPSLADQTKRYVLSSKTGDYSALSFKTNYSSYIKNAEYMSMKRDIIGKVHKVSITIATIFITIILVTAIVIIFLITELFIGRFTKMIAIMRFQGYYNREINNCILGMFLPFVLLGWAVGFFGIWFIFGGVIKHFMSVYHMVLPFNFNLLPFFLSLLICSLMFVFSYVVSNLKISRMNIQEVVNYQNE